MVEPLEEVVVEPLEEEVVEPLEEDELLLDEVVEVPPVPTSTYAATPPITMIMITAITATVVEIAFSLFPLRSQEYKLDGGF